MIEVNDGQSTPLPGVAADFLLVPYRNVYAVETKISAVPGPGELNVVSSFSRPQAPPTRTVRAFHSVPTPVCNSGFTVAHGSRSREVDASYTGSPVTAYHVRTGTHHGRR